MPKRTVKPYKLEVELEKIPLKASEERRLKKLALNRAPGELEKWHQAQSEQDRFYAAADAAVAAFNLDQYTLAEDLAQRAIELAASFKDNWNYGNAIHHAHTVLGLLALRVSDLERASQELRRSGDTPGSPQLGSFGPTMQLAKALLRAGQVEPVLEYLRQCRGFWSMGGAWLDVWEQKISKGATPNFFMHSFK